MKSVFMLVGKTRGPAGHGEPGMEHYILKEDGNGWEIGDPLPAFSTRELAQEALDKCSYKGSFKVREFPVV